MKKISLFMLMLCLTVGLAMAQKPVRKETKTPQQRAQRMTERMVKELSLNERQAKEVEVLNLRLANQAPAPKADKERKELCDSCKKILADRKDNLEKRRVEFRAVKEQRNQELKKILTKEQYELYLKNMKKRPGNSPKACSTN